MKLSRLDINSQTQRKRNFTTSTEDFREEQNGTIRKQLRTRDKALLSQFKLKPMSKQQSQQTFLTDFTSDSINLNSRIYTNTISQPLIKFQVDKFYSNQHYVPRGNTKKNSRASRLLDTQVLSVEEELKQKADDDIEIKARQISLDDPQASLLSRKIYKQIDKILEQKKLYNQKDNSIFTALFSKTRDDQQTNLLPKTFGIIGGRSVDTEKKIFNANSYSFGDNYAGLLGAGLQNNQLKNIQDLILIKNRLSPQGLNEITKSFSTGIRSLDLKSNYVGKIQNTKPEVLKSVFDKLTLLQELNLENNDFYDQAAKQLFLQLCKNKTLQKLNLSQNHISDASSQQLFDFISTSQAILELNLHWNCLGSQAGKMIANALLENTSLAVLDLSYNSIGSVIKQSFSKKKKPKISETTTIGAEAWAEYLSYQDGNLRHLDLSYNSFSVSDCELIAEALKDNHNLYGFHFQGNNNNKCYVDGKGFLIVPQSMQSEALKKLLINNSTPQLVPGILKHRRINGLQKLPQVEGCEKQCWICNGWVEQSITFEPSTINFQNEPIFVHFSHEGYAPVMMKKNEYQEQKEFNEKKQSSNVKKINQSKISEQSKWMIKRMFPPNQEIKFFFSCPISKESCVSYNYNKIPWSIMERRKQIIFYTIDGKMRKYNRPAYANVLMINQNTPLLLVSQYGRVIPQVECQPRQIDEGCLLNQDEGISENVKSNKMEYFSECQRETEQFYKECFEFDWNRSALPQLIKSNQEQDEVKQFIESIYRDLVSAYRSVSAYNPNGDIWCISLNAYKDLFSPSIINQNYGLKDMDIVFKQITARHKQQVRTQTQLALIRFQFMEVIVRLAIDKYARNDSNVSVLNALQKFYEEDQFDLKIESFEDPQQWRDEVYWCPEFNDYIASHLSVFQALYDQAMKFRVLNYFTTAKFLTPSAFKELFQNAQLIDYSNIERNINIAFSLSVFPSKDEVTSDRSIQMNLQEFIEAIFRVADKINQTNANRVKEKSKQELLEKVKFIIGQLGKAYNIEQQDSRNDLTLQILLKRKINKMKSFQKLLQENSNQLKYELDSTPKGLKENQSQELIQTMLKY